MKSTLTTEDLAQMHRRHVMPTYAPEIALVKGRGTWVWDLDKNSYLDFLSGISVLNVGHCHPKVVRAVRRQAGKLMHCSNLYYNELQPRLAQILSEKSLGGKVFFCNSGAEANEGLIKLARKWGAPQGRFEIITMQNSFHGRTLATLTATGQDKVQKGFEPLPSGFRYAEFNQIESIKEQIHDNTAAVLIECVQGEGGVIPADPKFMVALEALCRDRGILLLCDEIQTGMGRTGTWFAYQGYSITPDAISVAKALGAGYPIGAVVAGPRLEDVLQPGSHGSTFGGTPLACAAALGVFEALEKEDMIAKAASMGEEFSHRLEKALAKCSKVCEIRHRGLMIGIVLDEPAGPVQKELQKRGLLTAATAGNVIRMLPPLNVTRSQVKKAVRMIRKVLELPAKPQAALPVVKEPKEEEKT